MDYVDKCSYSRLYRRNDIQNVLGKAVTMKFETVAIGKLKAASCIQKEIVAISVIKVYN